MLSPAASDAAFRKAIQPKPYDGSAAADQFTAARDAYAEGADLFTFGGKTYKVPEDMGSRLIQAAAGEAKYIKARDDFMAEAGDAVSPPVVDLTDSKKLSELKDNVTSAVEQLNAVANSGDARATKLYTDKVVAAQNEYQAQKDLIQSKYDLPAGGNLENTSLELEGVDDEYVSPSYDNFSGSAKSGVGHSGFDAGVCFR